MNDRLLRAARNESTDRPPVWLMRQAGRHLPEYRELRDAYTFREAIEDPTIAAEITLQPWERYEPDGLVIFSDILTILEPLGFEYRIERGVGPIIENPVRDPGGIPAGVSDVESELAFVGRLLSILADRVGDQVPLIGFAGGPFTLASYLLAGGSSRSHLPVRRFRAEHPTAFKELLDVIAEAVTEHLQFQARSGADIVQLFDTYAGVLPPRDYREFLLPLHRRIFDRLDCPTIIFVRNMGGRLELLAESKADVVSLDWTVDLASARETLGETPVQGNLDPALLFADDQTIRARTQAVIEAGGTSGHILNLGHGVNKETPVEGVAAFVETAKATRY